MSDHKVVHKQPSPTPASVLTNNSIDEQKDTLSREDVHEIVNSREHPLLSANQVLQLQRLVGNQATTRLIRTGHLSVTDSHIQRKKGDAETYATQNKIKIIVTKENVRSYVDNSDNDIELRKGLLKAWNMEYTTAQWLIVEPEWKAKVLKHETDTREKEQSKEEKQEPIEKKKEEKTPKKAKMLSAKLDLSNYDVKANFKLGDKQVIAIPIKDANNFAEEMVGDPAFKRLNMFFTKEVTPDNFAKIYDFINEYEEKADELKSYIDDPSVKIILANCKVSRNRTPSVIAAYQYLHGKKTQEDAYGFVETKWGSELQYKGVGVKIVLAALAKMPILEIIDTYKM